MALMRVLAVTLVWRALSLSLQQQQRGAGSSPVVMSGGKDLYAALRCRESPGVVLIDGDNCRGKSRWSYSAAELCSRVGRAAAREVFGGDGVDTVLFLDHGERRDCFLREGFGAAFAGRRSTADDAIVDAVEWWLERERSVVVVTSDYGLRQRAQFLASRALRAQRSEATEANLGKRPKPAELVRFATQGGTRVRRFVSSEALVDAFDGEPPLEPPEPRDARRTYEAPFEGALDRLAGHVLTAPSSVRARKKRRGSRGPRATPVGSPLGNEQTWMRVVLAEKLRWLLEVDGDAPRPEDHALLHFKRAFQDPRDESDAANVLQHPLHDRKHRHELLRFADSLRRPLPEADDDDDAHVPVVAPTPAVPPPPVSVNLEKNRRLRRTNRKKHKRSRDIRNYAEPLNTVDRGPPTKALLADREDLEKTLRAWLRDDAPAAVAE